MKNKKNLHGFSLIEILVVIGIIGILSTFVVIALSGVRAKARDSKRKHDLATIGRFMSLSCYTPTAGDGEYDLSDLAAELLVVNPSYKQYLKSVPIDPLTGTVMQSNFTYIVDGDKCALYANLENEEEEITLKNIDTPTAGAGVGVLQGTSPGVNNTIIYFQHSN